MQVRALRWLQSENVVSEEAADAAIDALYEPVDVAPAPVTSIEDYSDPSDATGGGSETDSR